MPDYLPTTDSEFQTWAANFTSVVQANLTALGLSATEIGALDNVVDEFATRLSSTNTSRIALEAAVQAKKTARVQAERDIRGLVQRIQANPNVSDTLKASLGVTVRENTRSSTPPVMPIGVMAQPFATGMNVLTWDRSANKSGTQFVIECKAPSAGAWTFIGVTTKTKYSHAGQTPGVALLYRIIAQRGDQTSAPSEAVMVYGA